MLVRQKFEKVETMKATKQATLPFHRTLPGGKSFHEDDSTEAPVRKRTRSTKKVPTGPQVGHGDSLLDVLSFWSTQVLSPDDMFVGWNDEELRMTLADAGVYDCFTSFLKKAGPRDLTMCSNKDFFEISRLFIPGFKKANRSIIIPKRDLVEKHLARMEGTVHEATREIQRPLKQVRAAYANAQFNSFHMLVTPNMRGDTDADHSWISYYNITGQGSLAANTPVSSTRLKDMGTIHPLWETNGWRHLLHRVAGLACLHNLYIYIRFDAGCRNQYIFVHEQAFELKAMQEDAMGNKNRYDMQLSVTAEEDDEGVTPQWISEMDVSDDGNEIALPNFNGLRVRFIFRQDYSDWFY